MMAQKTGIFVFKDSMRVHVESPVEIILVHFCTIYLFFTVGSYTNVESRTNNIIFVTHVVVQKLRSMNCTILRKCIFLNYEYQTFGFFITLKESAYLNTVNVF